ncbi:probable glycine betaine/carnitine/choline ABC transporter [Geomicrobium sp. JCM 19037]|nr:probable glycine betaine/carnitine/choline ABC transporter [Geomicrobium sp. JCM 19037]
MVTADMNMGFARAVSVMRRQKVDSLLVVSEEKRLEGYVSIFDVIDNYEEEAMSLADILKPVEHVLTRDQTVEEGLTLMTEHQLSYVPVIGDNETLLGVITRGTIVGLMNDMYTRTPEASGVVS